jgi:hypothetical protein
MYIFEGAIFCYTIKFSYHVTENALPQTPYCRFDFTNFKVIKNVKKGSCVCDVAEYLGISGRSTG